jgi:hypothetical protein
MIRPVELSDALSKTEVAGKINQIQKASSEMEQRQAASIMKEKIATDAERTHQSEKSDLLVISKDKEKESKGKKEQNAKENPERKSGSEEENPEHLDLKV